jgi:hypothetical protein
MKIKSIILILGLIIGSAQSASAEVIVLVCKCRIPDDCIDPRRLALFAGRAFFRDLITTLKARQSGEVRP